MTKQELLARTKDFSVRIVKMVVSQKPDFASRILFAQILRSGTSVGANYRAACLAKSTKDFINKLKIVEEELDETIYWMEILIAADICLENGIYIETGPHKHTIQQTFFLYVYEPGGNRVEIANTTARLITDPDYETVIWTLEERKKGQAWGLSTVPSFHTKGTPMPEDLPPSP